MRRWIAFACICAPLPAPAQQMAPGLPEPRLATLTPAGAQAGTEIGLLVGGLDLEPPSQLYFSHPGIRSEPIAAIDGPPLDAANPAVLQRFRNAIGTMMPTSWAAFRVTVPADVPPGPVDVRIATRRGISNPRTFFVGDRPQTFESEPNDDLPQAQPIAINSVVFGEIPTALDVDFYKFDGKKGVRVLAIGQSGSIDGRLDLGIELHDASGRLVGSNHGDRGRDVVIDATLPDDGEYSLRVHHFTYVRGGPDQFYRLDLTTAPWIESAFPPAVEAGKPSTITLWGRNLPGGRPDPDSAIDGIPLDRLEMGVTPPDRPAESLDLGSNPSALMSAVDGFDIRVRNDAGWSNPALIGVARDPVVIDAGGNDRPESAQAIAIPCEVAGRIETRGDRDWYAFDATKGQVLSIEAWGDRLGSPIDLFLRIRSADGKAILEADENTDLLHPVQLYTRTDDPPRQRFVAPADGRYLLMISAREATVRGDVRLRYRLRIGPERPDFRLVAMPWSPFAPSGTALDAGGKLDYTVFAWRIDGFDGPISLSAEGLPSGVSASPSSGIGQGQKQGALVLSGASDAAGWDGPIDIKGTARIDGKDVTREARAASIAWPTPQGTNIPALTRLDRGPFLAVRPDKPGFALDVAEDSYRVVQGGKLEVPIAVRRLRDDCKGPVQVTAVLTQPPVLIVPALSINAGSDRVIRSVTVPPNAPPGEYSLYFQGQAPLPMKAPGSAAAGATVNVRYPSNPISLLILPKELARLTLNPFMTTAKIGGQAEVAVKVARQFNYAGEFRVELAQTEGVSAEPVSIAPGQDEARLVVKVADDAKPGVRNNLVVRATAMFRDNAPIVHEAKLSLNATK